MTTTRTAREHLPPADRSSFWERDPLLRRALSRVLPADELAREEPILAAIGAAAADEIDRMGAIADRQRPTLRVRDERGRRIDEVEYHPAYRRLEELAYREFKLVAIKHDPEVRARGVSQRVGFARAVLYGMGESGVLCPVCMTDGVARVLEQSGDAALARELVPQLSLGRGPGGATGAMYLTEKAGGSDVGQNETVARRGPDGVWRLSGEKWFCSNVDAELILALARPEGAPEGTSGLGLFLIERARQSPESFRIERLKDKLGTRTMPTGEVLLSDAPARLVGPLDAGFKQMAGMLNLSRLWNATVSCSLIGRAWHEAEAFARGRTAFGRRLIDHPLQRQLLGELKAEYAGALALVFEAARALDRADAGDPRAAQQARALTPLIKLFTAKVAVSCASEAVEALGGCGYIEDFATPRLLRDAQVLPIWEGTTNVLVLDLVRVGKQGALAALIARGREALERAGSELNVPKDEARRHLDAAEEGFAALGRGEDLSTGRRLAFRLARGLEAALLLEAAADDPYGPEAEAAARLAEKQGGPGVGL